MMKRLMALLIPTSVLVAGTAAAGYAANAELIPPMIWKYLWPSLIAVIFLVLGITCLLMRLLKWLWPTGTGFLVQTVGILMMSAGVSSVENGLEVLLNTLKSVGIVLFIMFVVWLIKWLRARWLTGILINGVGGDGGVDAEDLQKIRNAMQEALDLLKMAGGGRNAIYELPWFLVIGRAEAGKSVAIQESGLKKLQKDRRKGVGGTHTLDFFLKPELIFLDTPGEWTSKVIDDKGQRVWVEALRQLRKYRGRRPLDGIVVVVPAEDLLSKTMTDEELQDQAGNVREVIDLLQRELKFRFPVYLLVSKCDLVEGFVEFFHRLPVQRRNDIFGWSAEDPNDRDPIRLFPKSFRRVLQRLEACRLEMLGRVAKRSSARSLFFFTENFRTLERPLAVFADILFLDEKAREAPVFRGVYFTSGKQGEGSPMGEALSQLAHNLGVRVTQPQVNADEKPKTVGYFLLELFRTLMVGDEGLVGRTAIHWWRRRRDTFFVAFLPAGVAVFAVIMTLISYLLNAGTYATIETEVPRIVGELHDHRKKPHPLNEALGLTEQLRQYHRALVGLTGFSRVGMGQPGALARHTLEVFKREFKDTFLNPTLLKAQAYMNDPDRNCVDKMDVLYSIIWLRTGKQAEWNKDLSGLGYLWEKELTAKAKGEASQLFLDQFRYLIRNYPTTAFFEEISLSKMAAAAKETCAGGGFMSAHEPYVKFEKECGDPQDACAVARCRDLLNDALQFKTKSQERMQKHYGQMKLDLGTLVDIEVGAEVALTTITEISPKDASVTACQKNFDDAVMPMINNFATQQDSLIDSCRIYWKSKKRTNDAATEKVNEQVEDLKEEKDALDPVFTKFNKECGAGSISLIPLSVDVLDLVLYRYRYYACTDLVKGCTGAVAERPKPPPAKTDPGPIPPVSPVDQVQSPGQTPPVLVGLNYLSADRFPRYNGSDWDNHRADWESQIETANQLKLGADAKTRELTLIDTAIEKYSQGYLSAWKNYLKSVKLSPCRGPVPVWLKALSGTNDYERLLRPAVDAVRAANRDHGARFSAMPEKMQTLAELEQLVPSLLHEYQTRLRRIADDLTKGEDQLDYWDKYHRDYFIEQLETNSLVQAYAWVTEHEGLVQGTFGKLLTRPLDEAKTHLDNTGNQTVKRWQGLLKLSTDLGTKFPFTNSSTAPLAELDDVKGLLGGATGYSRVLSDVAKSMTLSPKAASWLKSATALSEILFLAGKDDLQPLKLTFELEDPNSYPLSYFHPEDSKKPYRIDEIEIYVDAGKTVNWPPGKDLKSNKLVVDLFGETSEESRVRVTFSKRKGTIKEFFARENYEEPVSMVIASAKGPWAPLKLVKLGMTVGSEKDSLNLVYTVPFEYKPGDPGTIKIPITVEGKGLARLLRLMEEGFEAPPPSAVAGQQP